jgi:hypothetical protein
VKGFYHRHSSESWNLTSSRPSHSRKKRGFTQSREDREEGAGLPRLGFGAATCNSGRWICREKAMRKSMLAVAAAVSMIGASSGAPAQSAAPLSLRAEMRAGAAMEDVSDIRGGFILPTLAVLAIIALVYVLTKDGDPASP